MFIIFTFNHEIIDYLIFKSMNLIIWIINYKLTYDYGKNKDKVSILQPRVSSLHNHQE